MQHSRAGRAVLGTLAALVLIPSAACDRNDPPVSSPPPSSVSPSPSASTTRPEADAFADEFGRLERAFDARLGVYAVDTGTGREVAYNDGERFAHASTIKVLVAGAVLRTYSPDGMDRVVEYSREDLVPNSPVTGKHVGTGMSLDALCDAAVRFGDNTAANLLMERLGGPRGLEAVLRKIGDDVTRTERYEPLLNQWSPGTTRDTSTPRALADDLRAFVLGDALGEVRRARLTAWLRTGTTGAELIEAGVPEDWVVGNKAGAGGTYGIRNDIAVVWPPDAAPLVVAIMSNRDEEGADHDDALIAEATSVVVDVLA